MFSRGEVTDLAPLVRRVVSFDRSALVRLRRSGERVSALVRLPFGVLAARTIALEHAADSAMDVTVGCVDLLAWLDDEHLQPPTARDAEWRGAAPPTVGWRRIDTVPDADVRPLVRSGALLDSVVLTVTDGTHTVDITLRTVSTVTRLGFLPAGSYIAVDVAGRWVRVAAAHGSVYADRAGGGLGLTPRHRTG